MQSCATTRTWYKCMPVAIADDWGTLCGTITYSVWEVNTLQETFYLLIKCSTTYDYLVHIATKGFEHFLAYHLAYLLWDDRHLEQEAHTVVLYLWEYLFADNLLDNQRNGNHDSWTYIGQSLSNDSWRRNTIQIIHMATMQELEDEFERHTIHVGHRQHRDYLIAGFDCGAKHTYGKVEVWPQCTIGQHYAFWESCSSAGVVDHCQFFRTLLLIVAYVFLAEILWEFLSI